MLRFSGAYGAFGVLRDYNGLGIQRMFAGKENPFVS